MSVLQSYAYYAAPESYQYQASSSAYPSFQTTKRAGKRTRRGGRGRTRRRGRKAREPVEEMYPWWYAHMARCGRTPAGMVPSEEGYPVILPSTQWVYILPNARNPHRASTYVPLANREDFDVVTDDEDSDSESVSSFATSFAGSVSSAASAKWVAPHDDESIKNAFGWRTPFALLAEQVEACDLNAKDVAVVSDDDDKDCSC